LVLTHSKDHPDLIGNLGNIALLKLAGDAGLVNPTLAARAADAYRELRRRQHEVRLQGADRPRVPPTELLESRAAVRDLWQEVLGE
jgi:glutamate-ammonia-ligase adenylyltransferase